jgi:mono/diheme cytochrome c family protein
LVSQASPPCLRISTIATLTAVLVAVTVHAAGRSTAGDGAFQASSAKRSVWDGVYSDAQAARGREAYEYSCASCHQQMPQDAPASLRPQTYLDLVAYLLQSNGFPAGEHELPTHAALLAQIDIDESSPGTQK